MKVEIVSVGTPLLMSDIVDINSSHVTRSLREIDVRIICRATVGEDLAILVDVLGVAAQRADVVLVIGGGQENGSDLVKQAVSQLTGRELDGINCLSYTTGSNLDVSEPGVFVDDALLVCLPTERREMAYLLENRVLPYLQ
ncbi:MAG: hypothetical protein KC413_15325, partial [Anaerolineales bacterium]|nr:hypothetical protein [Anaerolineales bacterium]